jgi:hypothetical protein
MYVVVIVLVDPSSTKSRFQRWTHDMRVAPGVFVRLSYRSRIPLSAQSWLNDGAADGFNSIFPALPEETDARHFL